MGCKFSSSNLGHSHQLHAEPSKYIKSKSTLERHLEQTKNFHWTLFSHNVHKSRLSKGYLWLFFTELSPVITRCQLWLREKKETRGKNGFFPSVQRGACEWAGHFHSMPGPWILSGCHKSPCLHFTRLLPDITPLVFRHPPWDMSLNVIHPQPKRKKKHRNIKFFIQIRK